jgi:hypothetical protein
MSSQIAKSGRNQQNTSFDPYPEETQEMPVRPYTVLHDLLPFYSDSDCREEVQGARLVVLRSDDPRQSHHPTECMPTRKLYSKGQILLWDINGKQQWEESWYLNPETGVREKAWIRSVEFVGKVMKG